MSCFTMVNLSASQMAEEERQEQARIRRAQRASAQQGGDAGGNVAAAPAHVWSDHKQQRASNDSDRVFDYENKALQRARKGFDYGPYGHQSFRNLDERLHFDEKWCRQMAAQTKSPGLAARAKRVIGRADGLDSQSRFPGR
jgi:hypothetical protein